MITRLQAFAFILLMGFTLASGGAEFRHENKPQNLKALFKRIHSAVHVRKDYEQAVALFRSMIPDEARARKAFKDNAAPETVRKILEMHEKLSRRITPKGIKKMARAAQKEVQVHRATTGDMIRYRKGSVAYKEFPGGTRRVARQVLRPGMTFYEVEFLKPGKSAGMKYHLLYWDGQQWSMMGPVWRAMRK